MRAANTPTMMAAMAMWSRVTLFARLSMTSSGVHLGRRSGDHAVQELPVEEKRMGIECLKWKFERSIRPKVFVAIQHRINRHSCPTVWAS